MKKLIIILLTTFLLSIFAAGQATSTALDDFLSSDKKNSLKSFTKLDDFLTKNKQDFDNSEQVVKLFNEERNRLGTSFESELWNYLGKDLNKHYWINMFVETEDYLGGNVSLPDLATQIRENALAIQVANDDIPGLGMRFTILRKLTADYYLKGNLDLAKATKKKAENIYQEIKDFGLVGADDEFVICVYENLEKNPRQCQQTNQSNLQNDSNSTINSNYISGGILNGKAISLHSPEYPKAASAVGASGSVNVEVLVDEKGNVVRAEAISGHQLLRAAAVEAAKKSKFQPFKVKGRSVSVNGIIVYNFNK